MTEISAEMVLGIVGICVSVFTAGLVYWFDRRRRNEADAGHRAVIHTNIGELHNIVIEIMLDVQDMETDDEGVVAERLDGFLTRNRYRVESIVNEIRGRQAHIRNPARHEQEKIEKMLKSVKWILDTYCPDDVPRERWPSLWKKQHKALEKNATVIAELSKNSGSSASY